MTKTQMGEGTILAQAILAALEAGAYFRSRLDSVKNVTVKSSISDLVTDVDPYCEQLIRNRIHASFPDHAILGEEATEPGSLASSVATNEFARQTHLWIVDPLDGTTNFVCGMPLSVVSIAYAMGGVVQVGVVYDPYRDEVFFAHRGSGAWLASATQASAFASDGGEQLPPGRRLYASQEQDIRQSVVATGFPTGEQARELTAQTGMQILMKVRSLRALGAAALHLAYVASGRLDAFWEYDLNAWDLAAGVLLVEEAGGYVAALSGESYHLEIRDILTSGHPVLAADIHQTLFSKEL